MRDTQNRTEKPRSLMKRIGGLIKKIKNKDRFKNAAYYTLSSESYTPRVSSLFLCFRSSGLGIIDSLFNALYMYAGEKHRRAESELKKHYGNVAMHPHGYNESCMRITVWSAMLKVMDFVPKICSLPSRISAARRQRRARGENSFARFMRTAGFCKRRASYILPAAVALVVGLYVYNASLAPVVVDISYDGVQLGTVENRKVMLDALQAAEETLSESTGVFVKLSDNITYSASRDASPEYVSSKTLYTDILTQAKKDYTTAYGLYIDGNLVAPLENKAEIETVLNEISGESGTLANGIQILKQDYPRESVRTGDELKEILGVKPKSVVMSAEGVEKVEYTSPDVIRNIPAPVNSDSVDFSNAYAIEADATTLELSYKTEELQEKTVTLEFKTLYEYDPNMYTTSKYVRQQGKDGSEKITEKVVFVDGQEQSRTVVAHEVIKEAVDKIVVKGLKPVPESLPEKAEAFMVWPIEGRVDEPFGWRLRSGSYMEMHNGIDMRAPRGTPILAAASGVVTKAGNFHNGYGNMVIIQHADGKETFYAHMNDIYISEGDLVTQATIIGEVGSTGDSTGNHIHFEVRVDGRPSNPLDYLTPIGE